MQSVAGSLSPDEKGADKLREYFAPLWLLVFVHGKPMINGETCVEVFIVILPFSNEPLASVSLSIAFRPFLGRMRL